MKLKYLAISIFLVCPLLLPAIAKAQATATITGTIGDSAGSVIAGAVVTVTNIDTNGARVVTTDNNGRFVANLRPIGNSKIQVVAPSFQSAIKNGILLENQASSEINFTLLPGSITSAVSVEANAIAVEASDSSLSQVVHSQQVADLPLNGRNFVELATLAPGTSAGNQPNDFFAGGGGSETSIRGSFSLSVSDLTLIGRGPLTNLALALRSEPDLAKAIKSIVLMGGSLSGSNVTPAAEFNFYVAPEAASIVFNSGAHHHGRTRRHAKSRVDRAIHAPARNRYE